MISPDGNAPRYEVKDDTSLFDLASVLLRRAGLIAIFVAIGALIAVLPSIRRKPQFIGIASFTPQGTDSPRAGLSALAGQFGIAVPTSNLNQSPQFYSELLKSRVVLASFARDSFVVPELNGSKHGFAELFETTNESDEARAEAAVAKLSRAISSRVDVGTGAISVEVTTPWRSVSLAITQRLLDRVNDFNLRTRQSQAANERRFVEGRLGEARDSLRAAEDRLQEFLAGNRQAATPALTFQHDRLQRALNMRQEVVSTLTQSYEEVRIREIRDTPVITVVEPPAASLHPQSRRLVVRLMFGGMLGGAAGLVLALFTEMWRRRRLAGDEHLEEFVALMVSIRDRMFRRVPKTEKV